MRLIRGLEASVQGCGGHSQHGVGGVMRNWDGAAIGVYCWMMERQAMAHINTGNERRQGLGLLWEPVEKSGGLKIETKHLFIIMNNIKGANCSLTYATVFYTYKTVKTQGHPGCHYMTMSKWTKKKRRTLSNDELAHNQISNLKLSMKRLFYIGLNKFHTESMLFSELSDFICCSIINSTVTNGFSSWTQYLVVWGRNWWQHQKFP